MRKLALPILLVALFAAPFALGQGYQVLQQYCPSCAATFQSLTASSFVQTPALKGPAGVTREAFASSGPSTYTSSQASGGGSASPGFVFNTPSGYGSNDYLLSMQVSGADKFHVNGTGGVTAAGTYSGPGLSMTSSSLSSNTCNSGVEGNVRRDSASGGTSTLHRTRVCICSSDGAASPTYTWVNITSGTVGTSTSCAD